MDEGQSVPPLPDGDHEPNVPVPLSLALRILGMLNTAIEDAGMSAEARALITKARDNLADRVESFRA
ncbi:hypothetical protein [Jiella sp. M17.18]|uniref:hypothetical protein n=1 Tax=Jiella sp. M17.18 TaxID=3234247 RepID=UPI0034DED93A